LVGGRVAVPVLGLDGLGLPDRLGLALTPLAYLPGPRPRTMVPVYPPGLPLHMALAGLVLGWAQGPFVVGPLAAAGCLVLMFLLGRQLGLSSLASSVGAATLAACPVFVFEAVQPMSDVVATFWALAALVAALRARRSE